MGETQIKRITTASLISPIMAEEVCERCNIRSGFPTLGESNDWGRPPEKITSLRYFEGWYKLLCTLIFDTPQRRFACSRHERFLEGREMSNIPFKSFGTYATTGFWKCSVF